MGGSTYYRFISAWVILCWLVSQAAPASAQAAQAPNFDQPSAILPQATDAVGTLYGTVSSLGYCDDDPSPIEGAEVSIQTRDSITSTLTTASGTYQFEFELEVGVTTTLTATVSAPDHEAVLVSGIVLSAEETIQQDFELHWLASCTTAEPSFLEVNLEANKIAALPIHLSNTGWAASSFTITEQSGGFTPLPMNTPHTFTSETGIADTTWSTSDLPSGLVSTPPPARPANELFLTQSLSQSIMAGNSISCNVDGYHTENAYLRIFDLTDYDITYDFAIARVEIGIEKAVGIGGTQPAILNLYTIGSDLNWDNLHLLNSVDVTVSDTVLSILSIPITALVPAGTLLVVEFVTPSYILLNPDGSVLAGNSLFIGSNDQGQTGLSYISAPDCTKSDEPLSTGEIGFPDMHLVMNVYGDIALYDPGDVPWLKETPLTGVLDPGSTTDILVIFTPAYTLTLGTYTSTLVIATDDPENNPLLIPVTMNIVAYDLALSTPEDTIVADSGSLVTYTVTLTNTSLGVTDQFDLSVVDEDFKTTLSSNSSPLLAPGETFTFTVEVEVGWLYEHHLWDTILILAQFHEAPTYQASIALTTRIQTLDLFLPIVFKNP